MQHSRPCETSLDKPQISKEEQATEPLRGITPDQIMSINSRTENNCFWFIEKLLSYLVLKGDILIDNPEIIRYW